MFVFPELALGLALVAGFFTLGMLLVCVPRPRKKGFFSKEEIAAENRETAKLKSQEKARRVSTKAKKKAAKVKKKKIAQREKSNK